MNILCVCWFVIIVMILVMVVCFWDNKLVLFNFILGIASLCCLFVCYLHFFIIKWNFPTFILSMFDVTFHVLNFC